MDLTLKCRYPDGHLIKDNKISDLQNMIPYVPPENCEFHRDLGFFPTAGDSDQDGEDSDLKNVFVYKSLFLY